MKKIYLLPTLFILFVQLGFSQELIKKFDNDIFTLQILGEKVLVFIDDHRDGNSQIWVREENSDKTELIFEQSETEFFKDPFFVFNNKLFFVAKTREKGSEIWLTDGTSAGTHMLKDLKGGDSYFDGFTVFKGKLYFVTSYYSYTKKLYESDGTEEGTKEIATFKGSRKGSIISTNNFLFYSANNGQSNKIFATDGNKESITEIPLEDSTFHIANLRAINNHLVFTQLNHYAHKISIWSVDDQNIKAPPTLLKEIESVGEIELGSAFKMHEKLYFSIDKDYYPGNDTTELWITDGNPDGTQLLKAIPTRHINWEGQGITSFLEYKDHLYFLTKYAKNSGLWKTDGTSEGTKFKTFSPYLENPFNIFKFKNQIFIRSEDGLSLFNELEESTHLKYVIPSDENKNFPFYYWGKTQNRIYFVSASRYFWSSNSRPHLFVKKELQFPQTLLDLPTYSNLEIRNTGNASLVISEIRQTGKVFKTVDQEFPMVIPPLSSKNIKVEFFPYKKGEFSEILEIYSNHYAEGQKVKLIGTAIPKVIRKDYEALVALFKATNGQNWIVNAYSHTNNLPWDTAQNTINYKWVGVKFENGRITELDLSKRNLRGTIPKEIGNLTELRRLDLSSNKLSGPLPKEIYSLNKLERLILNDNEISGELSEEIIGLTNLTDLYLGQNEFHGKLPENIIKLQKLTRLSIENNYFDELPDLNLLEPQRFGYYFNIGDNKFDFNDIIPNQEFLLPNSPNASYKQQKKVGKKQFIALDDKEIILSVPEELISEDRTYQWFRNEKTLTGEQDPTISLANYSEKMGTYYCEIMDIFIPDMKLVTENIQVDLSVPQEEYEALLDIYKSLGGNNWVENEGWDTLNNTVSNHWYGVKTEEGHVVGLSFLGKVENYDRRGNNLKGTLPESIGKLKKLSFLSIYNEPGLTGKLPQSITQIDSLSSLWIERTSLSFPLPKNFQALKNLKILNLSRNNFNDYKIPNGILELDQLEILYLYRSDFTGELPNLSNLTNLKYLDLSYNNFEGKLPDYLDSFTSLERINLSHNKLSGEIPSSLDNLPKLTDLNLGFNMFQGSIPDIFLKYPKKKVNLQSNLFTGISKLSNLDRYYPPFYYDIFLQYNHLTFADILKNKDSDESGRIRFSPQRGFGESITYHVDSVDEITMTIPDDFIEEGISYQWSKNSQDLFNETLPSLVLQNVSHLDVGRYVCRLKHPDLPGFSLFSNIIYLVDSAEITPPIHEDRFFSIDEGKKPGTFVGSLAESVIGEISFELLDTLDAPYFSLEGNKVYSNQSFDFEEKSLYHLVFKVNEGTDTSYFFRTNVAIINKKEQIEISSLPTCKNDIIEIRPKLKTLAFINENEVCGMGIFGKIFKSADGGKTWKGIPFTEKENFYSLNFYNEIGYALSTKSLSYPESITLYKSIDGGESWFKIKTFEGERNSHYNYYSFNGYGKDTIILSNKQYYPIFYLSIDGGKKWKEIKLNNRSTVHFSKDGNLLSTRENAVFSSPDHGYTWERINSLGVDFFDQPVYIGNKGFCINNDYKFIHSEDGGNSWKEAVFNVTNSEGIIKLKKIYKVNETVLVALDVSSGYYKSEDGGLTWEKYLIDYKIVEADFSKSNERGLLIGTKEKPSEEVLFYVDENKVHQKLTSNFSFYPFVPQGERRFFYTDDQTAYLAHGKRESYDSTIYLFKSSDKGRLWEKRELYTKSEFKGVSFFNSNIGYVLSQQYLFKTIDGTESWDSLPVPTEGVYSKVLAFSNNKIVLSGKVDYSKASIAVSHDKGETWIINTFDINAEVPISFPSENNGFGFWGGTLFITTDGGISWEEHTANIPGLFGKIIHFDFVNENVGFLSDSKNQVFRSDDGGKNWKLLTVPEASGNLMKFRFYNSDLGYLIPNHKSIYKTVDGGENWVQIKAFSFFGVEEFDLTVGGSLYLRSSSGIFQIMENSIPPLKPSYLSGETQPCWNNYNNYSVISQDSARFIWKVSGNNTIVFQENQAVVHWTEPGPQQLMISALNYCGDTVTRIVDIQVQPKNEITISGDSLVIPDVFSEYSLPKDDAKRYVWSTSEGVLVESSESNQVKAKWSQVAENKVIKSFITDKETGCRCETNLSVQFQFSGLKGIVKTEEAETLEGKVILFKINDTGIEPVDSVLLQTGGNFHFEKVIGGNYTFKVIPVDLNSSKHLPTYYGGTPHFNNEYFFTLPADSIVEVNMSKKPELKRGGAINVKGTLVELEGVSSGRIIAQANDIPGKPLSGIQIFLMKDDQVYSFATTNQQGEFVFNEVEEGKYSIVVDYKGIPMDPETAEIYLSNQNTEPDFTIVVGESLIRIISNGITGNELTELLTKVEVFPNPFQNQLNLSIENPFIGDIELRLIDLTGKVISEKVSRKHTTHYHVSWELENIPKGIYLLQISIGDFNMKRKIVK